MVREIIKPLVGSANRTSGDTPARAAASGIVSLDFAIDIGIRAFAWNAHNDRLIAQIDAVDEIGQSALADNPFSAAFQYAQSQVPAAMRPELVWSFSDMRSPYIFNLVLAGS